VISNFKEKFCQSVFVKSSLDFMKLKISLQWSYNSFDYSDVRKCYTTSVKAAGGVRTYETVGVDWGKANRNLWGKKLDEEIQTDTNFKENNMKKRFVNITLSFFSFYLFARHY
jgi:hypothetical protein